MPAQDAPRPRRRGRPRGWLRAKHQRCICLRPCASLTSAARDFAASGSDRPCDGLPIPSAVPMRRSTRRVHHDACARGRRHDRASAAIAASKLLERRASHAPAARRANAADDAVGTSGRSHREQHEFLRPAARERIDRDDVAHVRMRDQRAAPSRDVLRLVRRAGLVESISTGCPSTRGSRAQGQVARVGGIPGNVHEIEHDVRLVAHVAQARWVRKNARSRELVPHILRQEPSDRIAFREPLGKQARAVAEARRVPRTRGRRPPRIRPACARSPPRHVRRVAHLPRRGRGACARASSCRRWCARRARGDRRRHAGRCGALEVMPRYLCSQRFRAPRRLRWRRCRRVVRDRRTRRAAPPRATARARDSMRGIAPARAAMADSSTSTSSGRRASRARARKRECVSCSGWTPR